MSWWEEEMKSKSGSPPDSKETGFNYLTRKKRTGIFQKMLGILGLKRPEEDEDENEDGEDGGINQYSFPENYEFQRKRYARYKSYMSTRRGEIPKMGETTFKVVNK